MHVKLANFCVAHWDNLPVRISGAKFALIFSVTRFHFLRVHFYLGFFIGEKIFFTNWNSLVYFADLFLHIKKTDNGNE
jgi:hypothetical protein